jgi:hypothetical protein
MLALAALAASKAFCSDPEVMPCTKNFAGCFCRTCQFQRAAFPVVCQLPGFTTISILSASIRVVWQIPTVLTWEERGDSGTGRLCHLASAQSLRRAGFCTSLPGCGVMWCRKIDWRSTIQNGNSSTSIFRSTGKSNAPSDVATRTNARPATL